MNILTTDQRIKCLELAVLATSAVAASCEAGNEKIFNLAYEFMREAAGGVMTKPGAEIKELEHK